MVDKRIELPKDYLMNYQNSKSIQILCEVGRGASCIVYDANLFDSSGIKHRVRIKELYPVHLPLMRNEDLTLLCNDEIVNKMASAKKRFLNAYLQSVKFKSMMGLVNSTINSTDIFEFNNTMYIVMALDEGMNYGKYRDKSLVEILEHIKSLAIIVKKYHDNGYLHLDIKPENILVIPETPEHIYLFDFDSVVRMEELFDRRTIELSYSEGYSAPEQVQGQIAMIGCHTDIYAVGAILFSKIFNRHPEIEDCRISSTYYFDNMSFSNEKYRPKLYRKLSYFFHKTLSTSVKSRWSDISKVIEELEQMIALANVDEYYLVNNFQYNSANFVGRNEELTAIHDALNENQVLFLSGIGGIGKTELAKRYAEEYRDFYDVIAYAFFEQSLQHTVCQEFVINKMSIDDGECEVEYFKRILGVLKETTTERDLIIVDNFDVDFDENLEVLLQCPCKFIFTSRTDFRDYNYKQINIGRISNLSELMSLFSSYNNHVYDCEEEKYIKKLIEYVDGHTMTVELISKYLRDTEILPSKLFSLFLEKVGVTNTNETLVRQRKDRKMNAESVNNHLLILFNIFNFDELSKEIICTLSLFAGIRIRKDIFLNICRIDNCENKIEKLISNGWVEYNDFSQKVSLHQVIQDLIFSNYAPSTETCSHAANGMYDFWCKESINNSARRIKRKVFDIFVERIVGTDIAYARLCLEYGKEEKIQEAISICEKIECSESYDLLMDLLLRKIELICRCDDMFYVDMSSEEYIEKVLDDVEGIFQYAIDVCKKEEKLSIQCKMLIKLCDRIDSLLSDFTISMYFDSTQGQDGIYQKIVEIYDSVTEKLPEIAMVSDEKTKLYLIMRKFYSDEDEYMSMYRHENYGDVEKAYEYQELIDSLKENKEEDSDRIVIVIEPNEVTTENVADKYLEEGQYDKAIEYYMRSCEEGKCSYDYVASRIAEAYLKKGEVENAVCYLEEILEYDRKCEEDPDSLGGYTCYICIDLIKILLEHDRLDEVKKYACELLAYKEHKIDKEDSTSYEIPYVVMAYFYLYDIESDEGIRAAYWEKGKEYFKLLHSEKLDEMLYPFIIKYLSIEKVSNECIVDILDRFKSYSSQIKLTLIRMLKEKNVGNNPTQLRIVLDLREAELLNEYPYSGIKDAMNCCQEALKSIALSNEENKYLKNKTLSIMAEVMSNDNSFSREQVDSIKRECDYYFIAEVESTHNDIEVSIEVWNNVANQYRYIDKYVDELRCLQKAEDITLKILNQYDFSRFDRSLWFILCNKVAAYKELKDYKSAKLTLQELHRLTVQYYKRQENSDAIDECIYKLKDIAWKYEYIEERECAFDECILALHIAIHRKNGSYIWVEEFSKSVRLQLCMEILKELERLTPELIDTVIDLKDEMLKYVSEDFETNQVAECVISIISDRYQHNEIEFKK